MKEFMLLIRNRINHQINWPDEKHNQFLKACEKYIEELMEEHHLKIAQPLHREGIILSGKPENFIGSDFRESEEIIVGYYHIYAADLIEAVSIAKRNPEFMFSDTARVEIRPVKTGETETGFIYPEKE